MRKNSKLSMFEKISVLGVTAISLALIISATVMLSKHSSEILERSQTEAVNRGLISEGIIKDKLNHYTNIAVDSAGKLSKSVSSEEIKQSIDGLKLYYAAERLSDIRFFKGDKIYSCPYEIEDMTETIPDDLGLKYKQSGGEKASYLGITLDILPVQYYEFYAPIKDNSSIDGIALYFGTEIVSNFGTSFRHKDAVISSLCLCTANGNIVQGSENCGSSSIIKELGSRIGDVSVKAEIERLVTNRESGHLIAKINGVDHVVCITANKDVMRDLCIVELYEASALAKSTTDFINAIVAIIVVFIVLIVGAITYLVVNHARLQRKMLHAESTDLKLDCLNKNGFIKETTSILNRQKDVYYAVVEVQLRHYKFLSENFGEQEVDSLLNYLKLACSKICKIEESYGYIENGTFLMLLHAKDKEELISRLKIHSFLTSQYKGSHKFDVALKYGIYERQIDEKTTVEKMIEYASEANNAIVKATVENVNMQFNFYDDELRKIRLINEDMELRQDSALKDGEFQVFYQAKYSLKNHKQDGAEALVRWYDPKTGEYNKPALFMPLFESNGFIEKLDKYVYTKVCEYISYSLASGRNVFPVSVNVSRITATQPDFVDYYARTKKKFGIANGALTIEFTESFAYENYDVLKSIVERLHKAGFKTSIDDFGCGYSSYRILKELPMDEIKLDKFFIDYSENPDRINSIFESVIALAKKLNMKVTQEGVEREEDVELLKKLGCDVIQGYIYSHPLSLTDYLHFVENTKDHNL